LKKSKARLSDSELFDLALTNAPIELKVNKSPTGKKKGGRKKRKKKKKKKKKKGKRIKKRRKEKGGRKKKKKKGKKKKGEKKKKDRGAKKKKGEKEKRKKKKGVKSKGKKKSTTRKSAMASTNWLKKEINMSFCGVSEIWLSHAHLELGRLSDHNRDLRGEPLSQSADAFRAGALS